MAEEGGSAAGSCEEGAGLAGAATGSFFFQGMSRGGGALTVGRLGWARRNSGSACAPGSGGPMFSRQPARRACNP